MFLLILLVIGPITGWGQKHDYYYIQKKNVGGGALLLGYNEFDSNLTFDTISFKRDSFILSGLTINDKNGKYIGNFNGIKLIDAYGRNAINGSDFGLTNSAFARYFDENLPGQGIPTLHSGVILPTSSDSIFLLFNPTYEQKGITYHSSGPTKLTDSGLEIEDYIRIIRYSVIQLHSDGRLEVLPEKKEIPIATGTFRSEVTACKHANGKDWWLIFYSLIDNKMHSVYIDVTSLEMTKYINEYPGRNTTLGSGFGNVVFNPNGSKIAKLHYRLGRFGSPNILLPSLIEVMDFDRCSGKVSGNYVIDSFPLSEPFHVFGRLAFSPSGRFLYFANSIYVLQFDLEEENFLSSPDTVAFWNERYFNDHPAFPNFFGSMWRLPNGQIVIPWLNTSNVHVILEPDKKGASCDFRENYYVGPMSEGMGGNYQLPIFSGPYWPEYRMKPLDVICKDAEPGDSISTCLIRILPNPFHEEVRLDCLDAKGYGPGTQLSVYTILGQEVLNVSFTDYLQEYVINTRNWISGMYLFVLNNAASGKKETFKVVKQ